MKPGNPPERMLQFLRWFCREDFIEEFEGDLAETYRKLHASHPKTAGLRFMALILRYFRPEFVKSPMFRAKNPLLMIRHNMTLSYRNFKRYKTSFIINLTGLSTGLACVLLIYLWVADEYQTDTFHVQDSQRYQVIKTSGNADGTVDTHETTPTLLADAMAAEIPEVEYATNVVNRDWGVLSVKDKRIKAKGAFAGKDFFHVFPFPVTASDKSVPLRNKYSVYISSAVARKFFASDEAAIGKLLDWEGADIKAGFTISGVFESPAQNASMQFDVLIPFALYFDTFKDRYGMELWYSNNPSTYVLLRKGTDVKRFNESIGDFARKKYAAAHGKVDEYEGKMFVQGYADKYLNNRYENGIPSGGRIDYVHVLSIIAAFILIIACVNFMNLSTAQATKRLKEVGIKKVAGATRRQLIIQYISESLLMAILSLVVALLLVMLLLPQFNLITGKHLSFRPDQNFVIALGVVTIFTGVLAGSYPAFYLSRFSPTSVLKGNLKNFSGRLTQAVTRKALVAFQLTLSVVLIVSVLVVYKQIAFINTRNLGFNRNNVITFPVEGEMRTKFQPYLEELRRLPGVVNASGTKGDLVGLHSGGGGIDWPGKLAGQGIEFAGLDVDAEFASTMNIDMHEGRFFKPGMANETDKVIFNQAAVDAMQLKHPVGQTVTMWGSNKQIVGVVKNFHFESMYKAVGPLFLRYSEEAMGVFVKLEPGREQEALAAIGKHYNQVNLGLPFEYHFVDDDFKKLYASEHRVAALSRYFAGIAIVISCLGLFGLASFATARRVKEIGIRKTLGAGEWRIVRLLSAEFTWIAILAIVVAMPLSYYLVNRWLNSFAYRIPLEMWYFAAAGVCTLLLTWITVGLHTVKASKMNPTVSLRHE